MTGLAHLLLRVFLWRHEVMCDVLSDGSLGGDEEAQLGVETTLRSHVGGWLEHCNVLKVEFHRSSVRLGTWQV